MLFFDNTSANSLYERMHWGLRQMLSPFQNILKTTLAHSITLVGSFYMCWTINWRLTMLGLTVLGPVTYLSQTISNWTYEHTAQEWRLRDELNDTIHSGLEHLKTIRAFAKEPQYYEFYKALKRIQEKQTLKHAWIESIDTTISSWFYLFSSLLLTWAGGLLVLKGRVNSMLYSDIF